MPRELTQEAIDAIEAGAVSARDFMTVYARNRDTGAIIEDSLWSDLGSIVANVVNPDTGLVESRTFYGSGNLVSISDIPLVANLSVQNVNVELSHLAANAETLIRQYNVRQARIQIFRGLLNTETGLLVAPAMPRFSGFVDGATIRTATENDEGQTTFTCASHTQEVTRANADTRSDSSQRLRLVSDGFFLDSATTPEWKVFWGQEKGVTINTANRKQPKNSINV